MAERVEKRNFVHSGVSQEGRVEREQDIRKLIHSLLDDNLGDFSAIETLGGYAHESPEVFVRALMPVLDLERSQNFSRTLRALDLMLDTFHELGHRELDDEDFGIHRSDRSSIFAASRLVSDRLVEFVRSRKGNYVMHVLARDYLSAMKDFVPELDIPSFWHIVSRDELTLGPPIFLARPRQFGQILPDGSIGLSDPAHFEYIQAFLASIEKESGQRRTGQAGSHPGDLFISVSSGRSLGQDEELRKLCMYETVRAPASGLPLEALFSPQVRQTLERDFNITVADLGAREQEAFLDVLGSRSLDDVEALQRLTREYGLDGARAFLAVSVDRDVEREILSLGTFHESGNDKPAESVFRKFSLLVSRIDSLEEYIRATFGKDDPELATEVAQKILVRAREIIGKAHAAAQQGNLRDVLQEIEDTDADTRLFVDVCRSLRERGELDPKRISGAEYLAIHGGEFKGTFRRIAEEMLRIQREQYGTEGTRYSEEKPDLFAALNDALRTRIEHPESPTRFHVFMHEGRLVGFFRFDETYDGDSLVKAHLASVMGDPFFKGGSLIERLVEQSFEGLSVPVYAECDPDSAITGKYLRMGFVATSVDTEEGLRIFRIERDPADLLSEAERQIPIAKIHEHAKNGSTESPQVKYVSCQSADEIRDLLESGWQLTHWEQRLNIKRERESFSARLRKPRD